MTASHLRAFQPDAPPSDPQPDVTVRMVIERYLSNLSARFVRDDFSRTALSNAVRDLRKFSADHGHQIISECRQHDITSFFDAHPEWKEVNTKSRVVSTIIAAFNWALEEELIDRSPYRRPRWLAKQPRKIRRPADPHEYVAMMRTGKRPLKHSLFFMRRTGARTCEMVDLLWLDVHLDAPVPHIYRDKHKGKRRTGKPRLIGLEPGIKGFLERLRKRRNPKPEDHVFLNCDGTPWDGHTFARHFRRQAERIGLDEGVLERVSAYGLRHKFACDAIEGGVHPKGLADQMGHSDTRMIETRYASHTKTRLGHIGAVAADVVRCRKRNLPQVRQESGEDGPKKPA